MAGEREASQFLMQNLGDLRAESGGLAEELRAQHSAETARADLKRLGGELQELRGQQAQRCALAELRGGHEELGMRLAQLEPLQ